MADSVTIQADVVDGSTVTAEVVEAVTVTAAVSTGGAVVSANVVSGGQGVPGIPAGGVPVFGEQLTGTINGSNVEFQTSQEYRPSSTAVYLNGLREFRGDSYTETGPQTVTFDDPPLPGDSIRIDYIINE